MIADHPSHDRIDFSNGKNARTGAAPMNGEDRILTILCIWGGNIK